MCQTCTSAPARKARGFFAPSDELARLQVAKGGKIISRRLYADRDGFAAFLALRGPSVIADIKRVLEQAADAGRGAGTIRNWDQIGHLLDGAMRCRICKEVKPVGAFAILHGRPVTKCRPCDAERVRNARLADVERHRALVRRRYWANVDKARREGREWARSERGREANKAAVARYKARHPERVRARHALQMAIKRGDVVRSSVCQVQGCERRDRLHAHHRDYAKPLDAVFCCHQHHEFLHHLGKLRLKQRVGRYLLASAPPETFRRRPHDIAV